MRLVGDVHGKTDAYLQIVSQVEHSLQLGDLGFDYSCLRQLNPEKHKVCAGNHERYTKVYDKFIFMDTGHWLGDYGTWNSPIGEIFFVRGEKSIDWRYRKLGVNFFNEEELNQEEANRALQAYIKAKPDFVISHGCPASIIEPVFGPYWFDGELIRPSFTARLLDLMWNNHKPKVWYFGHYHKTLSVVLRGTEFNCLGELDYVDI